MVKKYFDIAKLLGKGVGSLFKGKGKEAAQTTAVETTDNISNVFAKNLVDEFGIDEVKEAYRIIDTADKDPQLSKLFYRENESKMDELVNLLESRYMSSERLHAHPLSFNRRGSGAADRYAKLNDTGGKLTDLPGGPGDRVLYFKNYGEMSKTTNREGKRVYKNEKPTIFAETPGGKKTKIIEGEIVDQADYELSPSMRKILEKRGFAQPGEAPNTIMTRMQDQAKQMQGGTQQLTAMNQRMREFIDKGDFESADKIKDAVEEYRLAMQKIRSDGMSFSGDLPILIDPTRKLNAAGGRVGKFKGGIMALLRRINPMLEKNMVNKGPFQTGHRSDIIGDMEQIKNVSRGDKTTLEQMDSLYDMVQESPRYNEAMRGAMMKLVDYERFRAILMEDNVKLQRLLDNDPEGAEKFIKRLFREGGSEPQFNQGGRVNMFAGGPLIGKGIMEAAKLAQRGIKPFGAKQTYKQNVKMTGMDEFQTAMKKQFDIELYKIDKVRGGNPEEELFDLYEDIVAGKRYSMLPEATKSKMISQIEDSMKAMEVDGGDYQNFRKYLQDQYGFADPTGIASGPSGIDRFPNFPAGTGLEALKKGIDKGQIKTMKAEDLLDALDRESGKNVIPFKPRTKKSKGGTLPPLKGPMSDGMGSLFRSK
jgi:hypothetical protein